MNRRRGCVRSFAVTLSVLAALACVALGVFGGLYLRQQRTQAQFEPPSVIITYPDSGISTFEGSYLPVSATAFGSIPITRVELWVDGQLIETKESHVPEGVSPFDVSFDLLVPQGLHTLYVRAVNAMGIIGDSWPVNVGGVERPGPDDPARVVTVEEGQTLDDIAAAYDVDAETARQLNPGLGGQEPSPGSQVVLPPPRSKVASGPEGPPAGPSLPTGGTQPSDGGAEPSPTGQWLEILPAGPLILPSNIVGIILAASVPAAPTDLQAEVTDCQIRLRWKDNADNEQRYEVWALWNAGQDPRVIAELEPGAGSWVLFQFPAPSSGYFTLWVEAVNFKGSQPSNKVWPVFVEEDCPQTLATHLQIELLDMTVPAGYTDVYCYVCFEGPPCGRVPVDRDEFIKVTGGQANIAAWASGNRKVVVPIPGDESVEVKGVCAGWPEGEWSKLGPFSGTYGRETWDGGRRALPGSDFEIGVAIKPLEGALDTSGLVTNYSYEDRKIPAPYGVSVGAGRTPAAIDPLARGLSWKWDGDPNSISGFQILLNGVPYNAGGGWSLVKPEARWCEVGLPKDCGTHVSWQVRAVAGQAHSPPSPVSDENDFDLQPCPESVYAMVMFNTIRFIKDCDNLDLYWFLRLNGVTKNFGGSCDPNLWIWAPYCTGGTRRIEDDCGPHSFRSLCKDVDGCNDPYLDTIVVALGEAETDGGGGPISIEVDDGFWDTYILIGGDDNVGVHRVLYEFSSLEEAQRALGCGREVCVGPGTGDPLAKEYAGYSATICYTLYIFPQPEGLNCLVSRPAYIP